MDKSGERALQHVGRDLGDIQGLFPGPVSLASCLGLQAWEPVRCSHAPHMETQRVGALWSRPVGARANPDAPLSFWDRRSLRHPKAPQKVQAGAIPDG